MSRNAYTTQRQKKELLDALGKTLGIVSHACEKVGCCRNDYYDWMKSDPEFKQAVEDIAERQVDFVESKLMQNVGNGDTTAQIFFLKCKGKKRGYVERQEITIGNIDEKKFGIDVSPHLVELSLKEIYEKENDSNDKQ